MPWRAHGICLRTRALLAGGTILAMTPRFIAIAVAIATYAMHAIVAWVSPIQGDDWGHWMWANEHARDSGGRWILELAREYHTFSDLVAFVLARSTVTHAIVTPLVAIALVVGLYAIAMRRLPR